MPDENRPERGRRGFFAALTAVCAAAVAAIAGVPIVGAIFAPLRRRSAEVGFVPVARLDALPTGRPVRVAVVAERRDAWVRYPASEIGAVWLVREGEGVLALSPVCPHLGCGVNAKPDGTFRCPCHDSTFDAQGHVTGGPSPRAMDPLPVKLAGGEVLVRYERFVIGTRERKQS